MLQSLAFKCLILSLFLAGNQELPRLLYPEATIYGTVRDESGGVVPGVQVRLTHADGWQTQTQTDTKGKYAFRCIKDGYYSLRFEVGDFLVHSVEGIVYVVPDELEIDQVMYLRRMITSNGTTTRLSVRVLSSDGTPIKGALVDVDSACSNQRQSDQCGIWWGDRPPGNHSLTVSKSGFVSKTQVFFLGESPRQFEVRLASKERR